MSEFHVFRGFSDGGVRDQANWSTNGVVACGWLIEGGLLFQTNMVVQWQPFIRGSILLGSGLTSFEAELAGAEGLVHRLAFLFSCPGLDGPTCNWFSSILPRLTDYYLFA